MAWTNTFTGSTLIVAGTAMTFLGATGGAEVISGGMIAGNASNILFFGGMLTTFAGFATSITDEAFAGKEKQEARPAGKK